MKLNFIKPFCFSASLLALLVQSALGQSEDDDIFQLSPFSVEEDEGGYMATTTISGTAMRTSLMNVPMSINVITSEFLEDSLIGDFYEALDYNTSITQTGRIGGNAARPSTFSIRGFRSRNTLVSCNT
jgi:outer membrane receptor protein involved in Fe transport